MAKLRGIGSVHELSDTYTSILGSIGGFSDTGIGTSVVIYHILTVHSDIWLLKIHTSQLNTLYVIMHNCM